MTPAALIAYRLATRAVEPVAPLLLRARLARGKEDSRRIGERLGHAGRPRPDGPLVWLHAVSVGETLSLLPLIERLRQRRPDLQVLVTSGTPTSADLMRRRLPSDVLHQYAPIDAPGAVARFLDHWRPQVGLFTESEIWPNLLLAARARGVRLALVSARITERSAAGWRRHRRAAAALFGAFDITLPQDEATASRLSQLGARTGPVLNLKLAGAPLPVDFAVLEAMRTAAGGRPVLLAASTHSGDDPLVLEAFAAADPDRSALLVIAPRHTERGLGITVLARAQGLSVGLRSRGDHFGGAQVHVADTLGELGLWFRLARAAYVGGGLSAEIGGHNPLEAARLDCPVISGPQVRNWAQVYEALAAADGVTLVSNAPALAAGFREALEAPDRAAARAARARALVDGQAQALDAGWAAIEPLLPAAAAV